MTVPAFTLIATGLVGSLCTVLPPVLAWIIKRRSGARVSSFFCGCLMYVIVVLMLERACHALVSLLPLADQLWFVALYSGFSAALFGVLGCWIGCLWPLKNSRTLEDALLFGIGFGWCEVFLLLGVDMLYITSLGLGINRDPQLFLQGEDAEMYQALVEELQAVSPWEILVSGLGRLAAMVLVACLAVLVMAAVISGRKRWLAVAFGLQFVTVCGSVLLAELTRLAALETVAQILGATAARVLSQRAAEDGAPHGPGGTAPQKQPQIQVWNPRLPRRK